MIHFTFYRLNRLLKILYYFFSKIIKLSRKFPHKSFLFHS
ncbi:hypothetical protein A1OE_480 [Candidatus Endolissoclinum faulkneri L2]|uniref:Uncharacterized protein n=1 Tax=Candidatus Endolissoclinum faulkneri L2 TaxID=1193729 RepID=K7Z3U6_9PROT|nr:hypothetical protein A1OE_480 [Candidatus Endolissoclinum faulkneri L2]